MKVLHITGRADIGGGPEHVLQLMSALSEAVDSYVACPVEPPYRPKYEALLSAEKCFDLPHRGFSIGSLLRLARVTRKTGIDVVHSHGKAAGLYGRVVAGLTGVPRVHTFHGIHDGEYGSIRRFTYYYYERLFSLLTAHAICVSNGEYQKVKNARLAPFVNLHIVDNGVSIPPLRKDEPTADGLHVLAVNRFDFQKNPDLLISIAGEVAQRNMAIKIVVYGEGEALESCRSRAAAAGLKQVINFAGPSSTIRTHMREAHVFLSTSRWEGMPLAVLEAMSEGLVPVLTDVTGNRDVVEPDSSGLLYPLDNPEAGFAALKSLAEDSERRRRLSEAARKSAVERYSVRGMATKTEDIYLLAIGQLL